MKPVVIVDYGLGNLLSVDRALRAVGGAPVITSDASVITSAERVVLPGVGAFRDGMTLLNERGLSAPLKEFAASGRPLLGICLGMQLLANESDEFEVTTGLGLIPGKVKKISTTAPNGVRHKIPHIGWNGLKPVSNRTWNGSVLSDLTVGAAMYFVHSFIHEPLRSDDLVAVCDYNGLDLTAVIQHENLMGCQFHPEKSGPAGLKLLSTFLKY